MTPLQNVININDPSILWGDLSPLYRGYQLSNTGLIRSMKFFHKFHYGILIDQRKDGTYELSNSSNQRVLVSIDELKNIVKNNGGYNIPSYIHLENSRNPNMCSKSAYKEKQNNSLDVLKQKVEVKFNIIDE